MALDQFDLIALAKSATYGVRVDAFERDDGTPLNFSLVNLKDWCKNDFEVVSQLRIRTAKSNHRYDVILLINGVPCAQVELKTLGVSPDLIDLGEPDDTISCTKNISTERLRGLGWRPTVDLPEGIELTAESMRLR